MANLDPRAKLDFGSVCVQPRWSTQGRENNIDLKQHFVFGDATGVPTRWCGAPFAALKGSVDDHRQLRERDVLTLMDRELTAVDYLDADASVPLDPELFAVSATVDDHSVANLEEVLGKIKCHWVSISGEPWQTGELIRVCRRIRNGFPNVRIIAGAVVSAQAADD